MDSCLGCLIDLLRSKVLLALLDRDEDPGCGCGCLALLVIVLAGIVIVVVGEWFGL